MRDRRAEIDGMKANIRAGIPFDQLAVVAAELGPNKCNGVVGDHYNFDSTVDAEWLRREMVGV